MIRIVIALVVVFLLWRIWHGLTQQGDLASRERWRRRGLYALGGALLALGVWFAATGRLHAAWIGLLGLFAWLRRGMLFYNLFQGLGGKQDKGFRSRFDSFFRHAQSGRQGEARARRGSAMTRRQAARVLEVSERASKEEITRAFRRKMRAAHPDVGGDTKLASQLNAARDALLDG